MTDPYIKAVPLYKSVPCPDEEVAPESILLGYLPMIMDVDDNVHAYALSEHRYWTQLHEFVVDTEEEAIQLYEEYNGKFKAGYYDPVTKRVSSCQSCLLMKYPKHEKDIFADVK